MAEDRGERPGGSMLSAAGRRRSTIADERVGCGSMASQRAAVLPSIAGIMRPSVFLACLAALSALVLPASPHAQPASPLGGVWSFSRSLSDLSREIGFNVNWAQSSGGGGQTGGSTGGGGRGRRGGSSGGGGGGRSGGAFPIIRESYDDSQRAQLLTAEARTPPSRLMIVETPEAVTFTNELGQSRTFHPTGRQESIEIQGTQTFVTARHDGDRLDVMYRVDQNREVHYTYSRSTSPAQLIVDVQFLEHGAGDKARLVYEPASETTTAARPGESTRSTPPGAPSSAGAARQPASEAFDERPGAELRGLKTLGILVEDLSAQAATCGLSHDSIEAALSKRLADGGFTVRRNSDDDTYLYVNVMTTSSSGGTCVSRYDAFLYTHATATLSYRDRPVLVQVSLMHRGGMTSGVPPAHATTVTRGLEAYVDTFMTQIREANK